MDRDDGEFEMIRVPFLSRAEKYGGEGEGVDERKGERIY